MCDLTSLGGVGIVEGILDQAHLAWVQMLHLLLADHDLLSVGNGEREVETESNTLCMDVCTALLMFMC